VSHGNDKFGCAFFDSCLFLIVIYRYNCSETLQLLFQIIFYFTVFDSIVCRLKWEIYTYTLFYTQICTEFLNGKVYFNIIYKNEHIQNLGLIYYISLLQFYKIKI